MARTWSAVLARLGVPTGDGRIIDPAGGSSRDLPLPLMFQQKSEDGHGGSQVVGRIETLRIADGMVTATGSMLDAAYSTDVIELLEAGVIGPSVDLDDIEYVMDEAENLIITRWRISGATLVSIPAFADVSLTLDPLPAEPVGVPEVADADPYGNMAEWSAKTAHGYSTGAARKHAVSVGAASTSGAATASLFPTSSASTATASSAPAGGFAKSHAATAALASGSETATTHVHANAGRTLATSDPSLRQQPRSAGSAATEEGASASPHDGGRFSDSGGSAGSTSNASMTSKTAGAASAMFPSTWPLAEGRTSRLTSTTTTTREPYEAGSAAPATEVWAPSETIPNFSAGASHGLSSDVMALTASASGLLPPEDWFRNPGLTEATPLTICEPDEHGRVRVFGTIAPWGQCHVGLPGCVTPPSSPSGYTYFHVAEQRTADGATLPVGTLVAGPRHADAQLAFRAAQEHYDDPAAAVARVVAGEDEYGIWVAGWLLPGAVPEALDVFRSSPVSGDWRRVGGALELIGVCSVNTPGFPVPRARVHFAAGHQRALIGSFGITPQQGDHFRSTANVIKEETDIARARLRWALATTED